MVDVSIVEMCDLMVLDYIFAGVQVFEGSSQASSSHDTVGLHPQSATLLPSREEVHQPAEV